MGSLRKIPGHGLVLPSEPIDETRALTTAYHHYLATACRHFLTIEEQVPPSMRSIYKHLAILVRQALTDSPRQMIACFQSPIISTPLQCIELRDHLEPFRARIDAATSEMLAHLLLEMSLRRLIPQGHSLVWEHASPRLASMALGGEILAPSGSTGLRFSSSHVTAICDNRELARLPTEPAELGRALAEDRGEFRFEKRFWRTGKVTRFTTLDHNPIAAFEAHPDKAGNHVDLGGHPEEEWVAVLDQCFALVEEFLPGEHAEMGTMLHEVIPVGYNPEGHLSASYREAVGTIYMTLHPSIMTMTEAVIHEFQHNKFNVSSYSTEYLTNAFHPLYPSPVRPDPRPLWGILLAVHAFLPVAELYRRMRDAGHERAKAPDFLHRLGVLDLKNHEGMEMLRAHAQLTAAGRAMFDELEALERRHLAEPRYHAIEGLGTESHLA